MCIFWNTTKTGVRADSGWRCAARQMCADGSDIVLVMHGNGLRGIVTVTDVLRSLAGPDDPQAAP